MMIRGTVQNGHVVPGKPLELPEGASVFIVWPEAPSPQRRRAALRRIRSRAVDIAISDEATSTESLYEP